MISVNRFNILVDENFNFQWSQLFYSTLKRQVQALLLLEVDDGHTVSLAPRPWCYRVPRSVRIVSGSKPAYSTGILCYCHTVAVPLYYRYRHHNYYYCNSVFCDLVSIKNDRIA